MIVFYVKIFILSVQSLFKNINIGDFFYFHAVITKFLIRLFSEFKIYNLKFKWDWNEFEVFIFIHHKLIF